MRISLEDQLNVALGLQSGVAAVNKFGRNTDIDIGTEDIWATGSSSVRHEFTPPLKFTEKTIVKLTGTASSNNSDVSADWDGLLIDN